MTSTSKPAADSPRPDRRTPAPTHGFVTPTCEQRRLAEQSAAASLARRINDAARERGAGMMIEASASHGEQQFMLTIAYALRPAAPGTAFDPRFWLQTHKAIGQAIRNRGHLERLRQFMKQFGAKKPFDGAAVARVMREQLGIPPAPPAPPAITARYNVPAVAERPECAWEPE